MAATTTDRTPLAEVLSPKQIQSIAESKQARIALWTGAVSSGKTIASLIAFLGALAEAPAAGIVVAVGRSLHTIERNILDPLMTPEVFGPLASYVRHTTGSSVATIFGRTVHLIGASDARSEGRIRGATVSLAYVDEATLIPESFWMMLLSRLRVVGARLLATTNPDGPGHWLRKNFIVRADEVRMRVFEFRLVDNPKLEPDYIDSLYAQYTGLWRRRFIDGEWVIAEGAVYDSWNDDVHVLRGPLPRLSALLGVGLDYGTTNPFAAVLLGVQQPDPSVGVLEPRLVIAREYRHDPKRAKHQKTDAEFSADLRSWIGADQPQWVCVDPSAASFKLQLFRDGMQNVKAAKNDVLDGIRLVASLLSTNRLVVHESCTGLIEEFPNYSWDPDAAEKGKDKPIKLDDHSLDALRYVTATTEPLWRTWVKQPVGASPQPAAA